MRALIRRATRSLLIAGVLAVLLSSVFASATMAAPLSTTATRFKIQATKIDAPPPDGWVAFRVKVNVFQFPRVTFGSLDLVDPTRNVWIHGSITSLVAIVDGYQFAGCGQAHGSINGQVCYSGAGQVQPHGSSYDAFSIIVTQGGSYSISGSVPAGSVQTDA